MTSRAQATAAPGDVTIDGKICRMSPLSDKDIAELDNWVRIRVIRLAKESLTGKETKEEREELLEVAFKHASKLTWLGEGLEDTTSLEGVARLLWQTLKKHHPDLTVEYLAECIVEDKIDVDETMDVFDLLHSTIGGTSKKKVKKTRSKKRKVARRPGVARSTGS